MTYPVDLPNPPDLDLLRAKVQGLAETVAANQAEIVALKEDNRRLWDAIKSLTPPVEIPDELPTPAPEPTPPPPLTQIGTATEPTIARWNVIPEQQVDQGFMFGVIAYHIEGIDYVAYSVNGGTWQRVSDMTLNPRTECDEYWMALNATPGWNTIRAVAVPKSGLPTELDTIRLYHGDNPALFPVIELDEGEHELKPVDLPSSGWLTVRPKPGAAVTLVGKSRYWKSGRLKLQDLTIQLPEGGGGIMGEADVDNHVWLDDCEVIGAGPSGNTWAVTFQWQTAAFTGCDLHDIQKVFFGAKGISYLVRDCTAWNIYEDVIGANGLFCHLHIFDLDRQPVIDATGSKPHPDVFQVRTMRNTIMQNVQAHDNVNAQGIFVQPSGGKPAIIDSVAIVDSHLHSSGGYKTWHPQCPMTNLLVKDTILGGKYDESDATEVGRIIFDNVTDENGHPRTR